MQRNDETQNFTSVKCNNMSMCKTLRHLSATIYQNTAFYVSKRKRKCNKMQRYISSVEQNDELQSSPTIYQNVVSLKCHSKLKRNILEVCKVQQHATKCNTLHW